MNKIQLQEIKDSTSQRFGYKNWNEMLIIYKNCQEKSIIQEIENVIDLALWAVYADGVTHKFE